VSQEKLDGEWVEFEWMGETMICNGALFGNTENLNPIAWSRESFREAYEKAKSTQSVDRISEERDLLRKALEEARTESEKLRRKLQQIFGAAKVDTAL
jgi:hypothetical protein